MKNTYNSPIVELMVLNFEDVITASDPMGFDIDGWVQPQNSAMF